MKSTIGMTALVLALAWADPAGAQQQIFKSGADLHEALQQDTQAANALNYIVGVVDSTNGVRSPAGACFDLKGEAVAGARLAQVVRAFLLKTPGMKERPGSGLVIEALGEAWPCS